MTTSGKKFLLVLLSLAAAASVLHGNKVRERAGQPGAMRAWTLDREAYLTVVFNGALHTFDARGRRVARQSLAALKLAGEPADLDWAPGDDGRMQAWFFDDAATPRLVRCALDPQLLELGDCAAVASGASLKANAQSRAVHLAADAQGRRVFIADAKGGEVRVLGFDGKLQAASGPGSLASPNRLRMDPEGRLVVADNDNGRIVWLDVSGEKPSFATVRTLAPGDHPLAAPGRSRAPDFAIATDETGAVSAAWLLGMAPGQKDGEVLAYGAHFAPAGRSAPEAGDPVVIEAFAGAAVVGDLKGTDLYRLGAKGQALGPFGDAAFRKELAGQRDALRGGGLWVIAGWAAGGLALLMGFVMLVMRDTRRGGHPGPRYFRDTEEFDQDTRQFDDEDDEDRKLPVLPTRPAALVTRPSPLAA